MLCYYNYRKREEQSLERSSEMTALAERLERLETVLIVYGDIDTQTIEVAKAFNGNKEETYLTVLKVCLGYDSFEEFAEDYEFTL